MKNSRMNREELLAELSRKRAILNDVDMRVAAGAPPLPDNGERIRRRIQEIEILLSSQEGLSCVGELSGVRETVRKRGDAENDFVSDVGNGPPNLSAITSNENQFSVDNEREFLESIKALHVSVHSDMLVEQPPQSAPLSTSPTNIHPPLQTLPTPIVPYSPPTNQTTPEKTQHTTELKYRARLPQPTSGKYIPPPRTKGIVILDDKEGEEVLMKSEESEQQVKMERLRKRFERMQKEENQNQQQQPIYGNWKQYGL
jgi:hypothetical protein